MNSAIAQSVDASWGVSNSDIMLLLSGMEKADIKEMLAKAKRKYVDERHKNAISRMENAHGYKKGKWKTYYYTDGKRKEIVRNTEEEIYLELYDRYKAQEEAPKTFSEIVDLLLIKKELELNRSYNTIMDFRYSISRMSDEIKNKSLMDIEERDLRIWLTKEYLPTRPKVIALRKMLQHLKEIFRFGISQRLCNSNPAEYIMAEDYLKDCDISRRTNEKRAFSKEELAALKEIALKTPSNPRSLMMLFAMETGLRVGELCSVKKSDVSDGFIHVHRQQLREKRKDGHYDFCEVGYTKDERMHPHDGRYVPITPSCEKVLRLAEELSGESDYIFHDSDGHWIAKDSYAKYLKRCCDRMGIKTHHNHAFRVALNSRLIGMGLNAADRAQILGHAVETNERHYSVSDNRRRYDIRDLMCEREYELKELKGAG